MRTTRKKDPNPPRRTVVREISKKTKRDFEGLPYAPLGQDVTKTKVVYKNGEIKRGKKITYAEKSSGQRELGSRRVKRYSATELKAAMKKQAAKKISN